MKTKKKNNLNFIFLTTLIIILIAIGTYNLQSLSSFEKTYKSQVAKVILDVQAPKVNLLSIFSNDCPDCFDLTPTIELIKNSNIDVSSEQRILASSSEAKKLIKKYNISKLPSLILTGEINKVRTNGFELIEDAMVFTNQKVIYLDLTENKTVGRIHAIQLVDSSCEECINSSLILDLIKTTGITIYSQEKLDLNKNQGKELIEKYQIKKLPAFIFSEDLGLFDNPIIKKWNEVGNVSEDGKYILREIGSPYLDLNTNKIKGLITVTYLTDETCKDCYDAREFHRPVLEKIGLVITEEKTIDANSFAGKKLIEKYQITKIPTIIITGDPEEHELLGRVWEEVGTVESDGAYVFRLVDRVQANYKDLNAENSANLNGGTTANLNTETKVNLNDSN